LSNSFAVRDEILQWIPIIKDATQELEEIFQKESMEMEETVLEDEENEDEFNDMELQLSEQDKKVIPGCLIQYKCSFQLFKKLADLVAQDSVAKQETAFSLDELVIRAKQTLEAIDIIGSSVYPPQNTQTLMFHFNTLHQLNKDILQIAFIMNHNSELNQELNGKFLTLLEKKLDEGLNLFLNVIRS